MSARVAIRKSRAIRRKIDPHFGPVTFALGTVFSPILTLLPSLFFVGFALFVLFRE